MPACATRSIAMKKAILSTEIGLRLRPSKFLWGWWWLFSILVVFSLVYSLPWRWAAFRVMEREFVERGHPAKRTVVACGGGLVVQPGMLEKVRALGVVVCLHASLETVMRRTQGNKNRPLLDVEDPMERIRTLYAVREPIYNQAGTVILTDGRPMLDIVQHVLRAYRREASEFARAANAAEAKAKNTHGGR